MPFLQLQPPGTFSIREDPHTVSKRWQEWATNLQRFIAASGVTVESQKREILLYTAGKEVSDIVKEVEKPAKERATPTIKDLVEQLTEHFKGRDNIVFTRYQFRCCLQLHGEPIDTWHSRLVEAATACEFGELRDSLIRD